MILSLVGTAGLCFTILFGLAWPLAVRLSIESAERILLSVVLSIIGVWLVAWSVYVFALPSGVLCALPILTAIGFFYDRRELALTLRHPEARVLLGGQFLVTAWCVSWLFWIVSYSGGGWASDWHEHWERARFFIYHASLDEKFLGLYALPARPPLANVVTAAFLQLTRVDFPHFQLIATLLSSLAFLPAAVLATRWARGGFTRSESGEGAVTVLTLLFMLNPLFLQNATFPWTKLPAAFFILAAIYFFLKPRPVLCALALAAGILAHYSAAPYAVILIVAGAVVVLREDRKKVGRVILNAPVSAGVVLLATWFVWSLVHYGAAGTFLSNTSVTAAGAREGSQLLKIALNLRDTVVPHFLRPLDGALIAQRSAWGFARDWFFQTYQLNFPLAFGATAGTAIARELWRAGRETTPDRRTAWGLGLASAFFLGVAVHGERDQWGLTHICLQSLVLLGLSFLAARWSGLTRGWRVALVVGGVIDLASGIVLQFAAQARWPDHPAPGHLTDFNEGALMNLAGKLQHRLLFAADFVSLPDALMLALPAAILMLAIVRARIVMCPPSSPSCPTRLSSPS